MTAIEVLDRSAVVRDRSPGAGALLDEDELVAGLCAPRKRLPRWALHTPRATELSEAIAALDAYYPARAEHELLDRHLAQLAYHIGPEVRVIEPAPVLIARTRKLLHGLERPLGYVPVEPGAARLPHALRDLGVDVEPVAADPARPFELPVPQHEVRRSLIFLPGTAIDALEPADARVALTRLGALAGADRLLLLGADGTRDPDALACAYDDDRGLSAAHAKHALVHLDRLFGATFDPDAFDHRALWNPTAARVELHLVSLRRQLVRVAGRTIALAEGEPIVTGHRYKHTPEALRALLATSGWRPRQVFTSARRPYRLWLCEPLTWVRPRGERTA